MVPSSTTSSGMMLYWSPPWILPMVRTRERAALISRVVMAWRDRTMWTAALTGATPFSGGDPWQPRPRTRMVNLSKAAMQQPEGAITVPLGMSAPSRVPIWKPKMASTPSSAPCSSMTLAPSHCSSAGWKRRRTVPRSSFLCFCRTWAAPMSMAAWASCPQACITPGRREEKGSPVSSWMGRASMSARRATVRPGRPPWMEAIRPLSRGERTKGIPRRSRWAERQAAVSGSCAPTSGIWCSSRRRAVISSCRA